MKQRFKRNSAACPVCGKRGGEYRIRRARKWKALPIGRSVACSHCNSHFIRVIGPVVFITERGFTSFFIGESLIDFSLYSGGKTLINHSGGELTED